MTFSFHWHICSKVREMDKILGLILDTLDAKNLGDVVNVIVTSDHGMTSVDMETRVGFLFLLFLSNLFLVLKEKVILLFAVVDELALLFMINK